MSKKFISVLVILGIFAVFTNIAQATSYLKASLSPNTPPGGCIWATSSLVTFTTFNFKNTAASNENIIIDNLIINNSGTSASSTNVLTALYMYDDQNHLIATSTAINNNTYSFNNLNFFIPPGWSRNITVKAYLGQGAVPGLTIALGLPRAGAIVAHEQLSLTPAYVMGNFPVIGNLFMLIPY